MPKRLAIIPGRGGSKRIPHKNIRTFCGQPMISYPIRAALSCGLFDKVHVSSDSDDILAVAESFGVPTDFTRPQTLADEHTPLVPVLKYVIERYAEDQMDFDEVWLLMACSPFLTVEDLTRAATLFRRHDGKRAVMTTAEYPVPIEWAYAIAEDGALDPVSPGAFAIRSQDLEPKVFETGSLVVFPVDHITGSEGAGRDDHYVGLSVPKYKAVDIDTEADWSLCELLFRATLGLDDDCKTKVQAIKSGLQVKVYDGLIVRAITEDDVTEAYVQGLNDPEVNKFLQGPRRQRQTMGLVQDFVRANHADPYGVLFGIYSDGVLRGTIRAHDMEAGKGCCFLGIAVFDKSVWGQGIGSAALKAVIMVLKDLVGLRQIVAGVDHDNLASQKLFASCGFQQADQHPEIDATFWVL